MNSGKSKICPADLVTLSRIVLSPVLLFLPALTLPLMDIRYPATLVCIVATFAAMQDILSFEWNKSL